MGLLDDAIREHLELKRRHGADPDEVARQENEALGETRRAEFARPEGAEPADDAEPEDFPVPEFRAGREPAPEPDDLAPRDDLDAPDDLAERDDVAGPEDLAPRDDPARRDDPAAPDEPAPRDELGEPDEPAPRDELAEPTAEYDVEADAPKPAPPERARGADDPWLDEERDEVPADESLDHPRGADGDPDEDVLEETPDFLQETPEHDRLWFEQRPPRDFDWDK